MKSLIGALVAATLLLGVGWAAPRAHADASYADGNRAYLAGEWQEAARHYEALVEAGIRNPDLFYNLGNAYFRSSRLGPAIYNYERALRLDPGFSDARDNLRLARETVATRWADLVVSSNREPFWTRAATFVSIGTLSIAFQVFNILLFGGLILRHFLSIGFARTFTSLNCVFGAIGLVLTSVFLAGHIYFLEKGNVGIVVADEVQMREATDLRSPQREPIHAGLRVEITRREPGWLRIELSNGLEGWVPVESVGEL